MSEKLSAIVGRYVELKFLKRAKLFQAYHIGCCPFHKEKTPSFSVNDETGRWQCFGCPDGGNVEDFLRKIEAKNNFEEKG